MRTISPTCGPTRPGKETSIAHPPCLSKRNWQGNQLDDSVGSAFVQVGEIQSSSVSETLYSCCETDGMYWYVVPGSAK